MRLKRGKDQEPTRYVAELADHTIEISMDSERVATNLKHFAKFFLDSLEADSGQSLGRLFQTTYEDDPAAESAYVAKTREKLKAKKRTDVVRTISVLNAGKPGLASFKIRVDAEHRENVLGFLNDARLFLGTRLGVTQGEKRQPLHEATREAAEHNLYMYFTHLEFDLLSVMRRAKSR